MPEAIGSQQGSDRRSRPEMEWVTSDVKPRLEHSGEIKHQCGSPVIPRSD